VTSRGFSKLDNPNHSGTTDTWLTPLWLIERLGRFDFDPCGFPGHKTADNINYLCDGLWLNWYGRVWLNPPYGKQTGLWLEKLRDHGHGIALVFARTDTRWFQSIAKESDWVFFIAGRIKFLDSNFNESTNAGHGSCLIGFGEDFNFKIDGVLMKAEAALNFN